ncbi:MAG: ABC transporter ATP-binding protein [Deinococcaceae bacterium]
MQTSVLTLLDITKTYVMGDGEFQALKGVSLTIDQGEMVALMGPSGSGKTTLMQIIGLLDRPTSGEYILRGREVTDLSENERAHARNLEIGFVFQSFHLMPRLTLHQNVEIPMVYAGVPKEERRARVTEVLDRVGLLSKQNQLPSQLSGGQRQRVAIARALTLFPALLLADEPTGNLDTQTSREVMELFLELNSEGTTVVLVTHEPDIAAYTGRIIRVRDGCIESDRLNAERRFSKEVH